MSLEERFKEILDGYLDNDQIYDQGSVIIELLNAVAEHLAGIQLKLPGSE